MSSYLYQAAYTPESWAHQVKNQQDPVDRVRPLVEACGGTLQSLFYCFGDYDLAIIFEAPDDESAAAVALAASAGGSLRTAQTTKLLTVEEGMTAMRRAEDAGRVYTPPVPGIPRQSGAPTSTPTT